MVPEFLVGRMKAIFRITKKNKRKIEDEEITKDREDFFFRIIVE